MALRLRHDIHEGKSIAVLIDLVAGDLTAEHFGENIGRVIGRHRQLQGCGRGNVRREQIDRAKRPRAHVPNSPPPLWRDGYRRKNARNRLSLEDSRGRACVAPERPLPPIPADGRWRILSPGSSRLRSEAWG